MIFGYLRQRLCAVFYRDRGRPSRNLADPAQARDLAAALADLPNVERRVCLLHACVGIGYREIADELNLSPLEVERHLASALVRLDQFGTISARAAVARRAQHD